jgi:hypothetical protein
VSATVSCVGINRVDNDAQREEDANASPDLVSSQSSSQPFPAAITKGAGVPAAARSMPICPTCGWLVIHIGPALRLLHGSPKASLTLSTVWARRLA